MEGQRYHLTYKLEVHKEGLTKEEVMDAPGGLGACDACIFVSILLPLDGSYGQAIKSLNGKTGEPLPPKDLFKAWWLMAKTLAEHEELDEHRRAMAKDVWDAICNVFFPGRAAQ